MMTVMKFQSIIFVAFAISLFTEIGYSANLFNCVQPDGRVTFSDVECPDDAAHVDRMVYQKADTGGSLTTPSIQDQLRAMESMRSASRRRQVAPSVGFADQEASFSTPQMTRGEAFKKAMKDAGYRDYSRLTGHQRDRVKKAMEKYDYAQSTEPSLSSTDGQEDKNKGAINPRTGEYLAPSGSGYVGTRDGRYYAPAGPSGAIDTRTGEFVNINTNR